MPQIDLDQDVFDHIRSHVRDFGETPSSVLRRLLSVSTGPNPPSPRLDAMEQRPVPGVEKSNSKPPSNHPKHEGTAIQRYMAILSELYRADPVRFERVESVTGRKRIYFHKSSLVIDSSGSSVMPEKIPDTPYYAATNLSDDKKKRILVEVLKVLGIHGEQRSGYLSELDNGHVDHGSDSYHAEDLDDLI